MKANIQTTGGISSQRELIWPNILFFAITTLAALIGCPLYLRRFGISPSEISLFAFYTVATGLSITAGYHRLFSHAAYKANPLVQFFFLFFGAAAFEQSALDWSSQHRDHHRYVDTDRDPYNIRKGFFYAHIGWLVFWKHVIHYDNVRDLQKNALVMSQSRHYHLWAVTAGILTPLLIGAAGGHALGAFLFSICLRLTVVYHSTFCINSVCHKFGKATYDIYASARDHWLVAFITNGEGYHNFHHRFPGDYRNGVRWYQWDPTKWLIAILHYGGLTWDLKRISSYRILEARLAAENQSVQDSLRKELDLTRLPHLMEALNLRYGQLKEILFRWEEATKEYQRLAHAQVMRRSKKLNAACHIRMREGRKQFKKLYGEWHFLIQRRPCDLQRLLLPAGGV